jgi:hypothetical protein
MLDTVKWIRVDQWFVTNLMNYSTHFTLHAEIEILMFEISKSLRFNLQLGLPSHCFTATVTEQLCEGNNICESNVEFWGGMGNSIFTLMRKES